MKARVRWHWFRPALGVVITLLAGAALAPASARAGCGDYVSLRGQAHAGAGAATKPASTPAAPRPPCSGPGCSSHQPVVPAPAPVTPNSSTGQDWACAPAFPTLPVSRSHASPSDESVPRPVRRADGVYHPPR